MESGAGAAGRRKPAGDDETLPLVERVLGGEKQAFDEIVRLHERNIYRTCIAITGNDADAEEATQDTFIKAYCRLASFRREARFNTWLTRIAINESLHRLRGRGRMDSLDAAVESEEGPSPRQIEDWHPNPEQLYRAEELKALVEDAVLALAPRYRVVFILRDVCDFNVVETAAALDLTIAAVKSRLLRARLMVREQLAETLQTAPTLRKKFTRAGSMMTMMMHSMAARLMRSLRPGARGEG